MQFQSREEKHEASLPTQSRVDVRTLAMLSDYWMSNGVDITTVSQLVSWSLELMLNTLRTNGKISREIQLIDEAEKTLYDRNLAQRSMVRRNMGKSIIARGFQNLRIEGVDPQAYDPEKYKAMHKREINTPNVVRTGPDASITKFIEEQKALAQKPGGSMYSDAKARSNDEILEDFEAKERRKKEEMEKAFREGPPKGLVVIEGVD